MRRLGRIVYVTLISLGVMLTSELTKSGIYGPNNTLKWEDGVDRNIGTGYKRVCRRASNPRCRSSIERQTGAGLGSTIKYSAWNKVVEYFVIYARE